MGNPKLEIALMPPPGKAAAASWVYPEVQGTNPPERWGHSVCFSQEMLYVFGGCRGGLHFSDVMCLDFKNMAWSSFVCTGQQPGTRDSHTAVLHGRSMVIFGGTNGSKKINDVHILNLDTHVWSCPNVGGTPPPARESHSATLVDANKVVIFGGTGEGEGNYLNDVHLLELDTMTWVSPSVKGEPPVCRDSHTAVVVDEKLVVYGGDCGDRYLGEVDILDLRSFTWTKMDTLGTAQPGVRAGHVAVEAENKVYVFGGVGDRAYYNDVWALDICTRTWLQVDVAGLQPQGRFSHVAVLRDDDIAIYGGCGEDERPLDEVIVLHLGIEKLNTDFPTCRFAQAVYDMERRKPSVEVINDDGLCDSEARTPKKDLNLNKISCQWKAAADPFKSSGGQQHGKAVSNQAPFSRTGDISDKTRHSLNEAHGPLDLHRRARARKMPFPYMEHLNNLEDNIYSKRRKTTNLVGRLEGMDSEQDEISPTMSKQASPTLSDQDRDRSCLVTPAAAASKPSRPPVIFLQHQQEQNKLQEQQVAQNQVHAPAMQQLHHAQNLMRIPTLQLQLHLPGHQTISLPVHEAPAAHLHGSDHLNGKHQHQHQQQLQQAQLCSPRLQKSAVVGSEVRGVVDGAFDSGYLMTAQLNGQVFRGVLFSPGPMHAAIHRQAQGNTAYPPKVPLPVAIPHNSSSSSSAQELRQNAVPPQQQQQQQQQASNAAIHGVVLANGTIVTEAGRQVQIMGAGIPQSGGRWVWQPSAAPSVEAHHKQQQQQQQQQQSQHSQESTNKISFPQSFALAAANVPSAAVPQFRISKNLPQALPSEPAVTLSLGGPGQSARS